MKIKLVILMLLLSFAHIGCVGLAENEGKENMSPLEKIEYWTSVYLGDEKTPQEFVAMITNDVDYTFLDDGIINFKSKDIYFDTGSIYFGEKSRHYYILRIKPEANVKLSELEFIWGKSKKGLMYPEGIGRPVVFEDVPIKPSDKYKTTMRAYIDGPIESEESNVISIKVRREEPIIAEVDEN